MEKLEWLHLVESTFNIETISLHVFQVDGPICHSYATDRKTKSNINQ